MGAEARAETLVTITVKAENPQVKDQCFNRYRRYRVLPITLKSLSHRRYTGDAVPGVPKLIRFDNRVREVA